MKPTIVAANHATPPPFDVTQLAIALATEATLTAKERVVAIHILLRGDKYGTQATIAAELNFGLTQTQECIARLIKVNVLASIGPGRYTVATPDVYSLKRRDKAA
jgi:hypothetical protein